MQPLEAQRDPALFAIDRHHMHFDVLPAAQHIGGMIDAPPRNLADVRQPFDAAQIDERAEVAHGGDDSAAALAGLQIGQQQFNASAIVIRQPLGQHKAAMRAIEFDDLAFDDLPHALLKFGAALGIVGHVGHVQNMRGGHEAVQAVPVHQQRRRD